MHQAIYEELKRVAKQQRLTTYGEMVPLARLDIELECDRAEIGRLLGEICEHEHHQGRPLLSAIVVLFGESMPGAGFFSLARELRRYQRRDDLSDLDFFVKETKRVWDWWKNEK